MIGDRFAMRQERVRSLLGEGAALVLPAAPELRVGIDGEVRYAVDSELFYLTGYAEPEAVLVLRSGYDGSPFTLFVRPRDPERERWTGMRGGVEEARERFGADTAFSIADLSRELPPLLAQVDTIYGRVGGGRQEVDGVLLGALERARRARPRTGRGPRALVDPGVILDEMRLRKDPAEVEHMRAAARVSTAAFADAIACIRPGAHEYEVEAALDSGFRRRGGSGPAFPTIVAGGGNAAVLHYTANASELRAGDLVLLDAGARVGGYCADISRTVPVSGTFTSEQRVLHDGVLAALRAGSAAAKPGATVDDVHDAAVDVLARTLVELGFLHGPPESLRTPEREAEMRPFYPHRTSHWLGLDVHDVGDYRVDGAPRRLEPGMVLTVEPGLYLPADAHGGPAALHGTGIRIEDDILITEDGNEVLTAALPAAAADIEAMR
jgi:Xaa-Pro aminopeptidase